VFFLGIGAYLVYNQLSYGGFLEPLILASKHQSSVIGNVTGITSLLYYPYTIFITNVFIVFMLFSRRKGSYHAWIPLAVFFLYMTIIPHKQPRFALLFLPYVMILASQGFVNVVDKIKQHRLLRTVVVFLLPAFLAYPAYFDFQIFSRLPSEEPPFVADYYMYDIEQGHILTSDPVPAAYTDNRYIGYYNNITDAHEIIDANRDISAVIYTQSSFPCMTYECNSSKRLLEQKIRKDRELVYNKTWWDDAKHIYVRK